MTTIRQLGRLTILTCLCSGSLVATACTSPTAPPPSSNDTSAPAPADGQVVIATNTPFPAGYPAAAATATETPFPAGYIGPDLRTPGASEAMTDALGAAAGETMTDTTGAGSAPKP